MTEHEPAVLRRPRLPPRDAEARPRRGGLLDHPLVPAVALGLIVLCALLITIGASAHRSGLVPPSKGGFPGWMVGPFKGVASGFTRDRDVQSLLFSGLIVLMTACYLVVLAGRRHVRLGAVVATLVATHVILVLGPPLPLTDVFNYFDYARLGALHGLNPYSHVPADVAGDASYDFATWHHLASPYGPLFTLFNYALVPLGLPVGYWLLKVLTMLASLGGLYLVASVARSLGREELPAVVFVGLNPLLLVFGLGGVHNEFFTMLLVVGAMALVTTRREASGGALTVAAAGIKVSAAMLAPFAVLGSARRGRAALGALACVAVLTAASLAAFGAHGPELSGQTNLVSPLGLLNLLGLALGFGGETAGMRVGAQVAALAVLGYLLLRTSRGADWIEMAGWAVLALVLSLSWVVPWYVMWLLPLAAVSARPALRKATIVLTVWLLATSLPATGQLLAEGLKWYPDHTKLGRKHVKQIRHYLK